MAVPQERPRTLPCMLDTNALSVPGIIGHDTEGYFKPRGVFLFGFCFLELKFGLFI